MSGCLKVREPTRKSLLAVVVSLKIFAVSAVAQDVPIYEREAIFHPVVAKSGMVSSQEDLATQAGLAVLKAGGNAVDAAVTIGFTLAVTLPEAGNLGGGGFMLVHRADGQETVAIDYREKAPLAATPDMFLDAAGEVDSQKARFSHLSVGVPGTVAGLIMALEKYGTISLRRALKPAIELADRGVPVDEALHASLIRAQKRLQAHPASREIFYKPSGVPYEVGEILVQEDLAESLKLIAREGKDAFYRGEIANKIVAEMESNGGLITKEDLVKYQPIVRKPIIGTYRGYEIYSMPPPSSGGVHLVQILNILEFFPISSWGHNTAQTIHLMAESMKVAYADRYKFMGDSDFVSVPISRLISKAYAAHLKDQINLNRARSSQEILLEDRPQTNESEETTHYSVIDRHDNAVVNTYTLNFSYGTGITASGTGILLNNEMDDFTAKPGTPNGFQLPGGKPNTIEPEKRMLSSMTPTLVMKEGKPFLLTGSPGGSRIITTVLQIILNAIDHQMNIASATNAVRVHHQWFPDRLQVERELNGDTINLLTERGQAVAFTNTMGGSQSIMQVNGWLYGASDPRKPGSLTLGY